MLKLHKLLSVGLTLSLLGLPAGLQAQKLSQTLQDKAVAKYINKAAGLEITDDGQVLVTSRREGSLLVQDGDQFKIVKLLPKIFADNDVTGIEQMADGRLVLVNDGDSEVALVDASLEQLLQKFAKSGDDAGELKKPQAVAGSINNRIYVADRDNNRISVFNDQGLFLQQIGQHDRDARDLLKPTHLALDASEQLYVLEAGDRNRVTIFDRHGNIIKQLDTKALGELLGSKIDFSAMTADYDGRLYLADDNSRQVFVYDWQNEQILSRFGTLGQSRGQYRDISLLAVNQRGQLAVLDKKNAKVEVYQLEQKQFAQATTSNVIRFAGKQARDCVSEHVFVDDQTLCIKAKKGGIRILAADGKELGRFAEEIKAPQALHSGRQMVAILEKNMLHAYRHNGEKIYSLGRYGTSPGAFDKPTHVFTAHNQIYVTDKGNRRIQIFAGDGQFVAQIKASDQTFDNVGPIAVDSQQNIYLVDPDSRHKIKMLDKEFMLNAIIGYKELTSHKAKAVHALDVDQQDRLYALVTTPINDYSIRVYQQLQLIKEFGAGAANGSDVFFLSPGSISVASSDKNRVFLYDGKQKQQYLFDYLEYPDPAFALQATGNKQQLTLQWDSTRSPLIASYRIEAAVDKAGPYATISDSSELSKTLTEQETGDKAWFRIVSISGFGLAAKPSAARENQFYKLQQLYQAQAYPEVIKLADRLLKFNPDNEDALHLKAESLLKSGQQQAAINSFHKLEQSERYKNLAIRQQVKAYYELEQFLDAKSKIDQVLALQPTEVDPYLICAELSLELADSIGTVTCAEDGLAKHPEHAELRYLLGKGYLLAGIIEDGLLEFDTVIQQHPEQHQIRLQIADEMMRLQRHEQALAHYEAVATAAPQLGQANIGRANALLLLDRDDEAKALAIKLSANQATKGDGFYILGKLASKQEKYTEAVLRLTRAGKARPQNVDIWLALANAYIALNQPGKAVPALVQGIKANPEAFELFELAGRLELEQEKYTQANSYLDKAVSLNNKSLPANLLYARSLFATRNYRSAASYAEQAARLAPKDVEVLVLQADIANQQGKVGSAIEFMKTALSLQPASADLMYRLGRVYQQANLFDQSRTNLDKAAAINSAWAEPHVALGELYSKRRLFDDAIAAFEQAVELDPSENNRALLNSAFADKKRSLEFKSNAAQLVLSDLNLNHVFSAAYKKYANQSIGSVRLENVSGTDYGNLQLSFQIKEYMDFPITQEIPMIRGGEQQEYDFKVTFNNKILDVDEDIGVQVEVKLNYNRDGQKDSIRLTQPMTIYGKNAMVWGEAMMVGSFVTPKDDPLRNYVRSVINQYQPNPGPLNDKLVAAMTYFSSLSANGLKYLIDPNTPYTTLRDDQVDYVQFPRETLKLRSGDCDDLSVLISAGLENLGIETVLLEVPGHLFLMFNTGLPEAEAGLISQDNSLLSLRNGQVWIPLEATMVNASFSEAWAEGARKYQLAQQQNELGIIDLRQSWQQYKPVTLGKSGQSIELPAEAATRLMITSAQNQLLSKSIDRLILPYQTIIANNPQNLAARMQIAILYTRYGLYDDAQLAFDALQELAPEDSGVQSNLGNLYLLTGRFDDAITSYQQAASLDDQDGGIALNLSMAYYRKGELKTAATHYQQAIAL
nr:tetratricopeptide repeat protein [Gammaproteobacteria bacterium]